VSGHPFIDAQGESRHLLVALDGRAKLALLLAALLLNLLAGGWRVPLLLALLAYVGVRTAGVRPAIFWRRMAVPMLLAVMVLVSQLFWYQHGEALPVFGDWPLVVHGGGLERGLDLAARIGGGMAVLLCFALSTPLPELMRAARFFRCPAVLVELTLIMYRYIFLLLEEGVRIRVAQRSRLGFVNSRAGLRSTGILGGMLVLRTYDRAERSFAAMRCRGYQGALTAVTPAAMQGRDWGALVVGLAVLVMLYGIR
jgi:cobalt/nickel transport system permease protein